LRQKASDSAHYAFPTIPPATRAAGLVTTWFSSFIGGANCGGRIARVSWRAAPRRSDTSEFWPPTSSAVLGGLAFEVPNGFSGRVRFSAASGFPRRKNALKCFDQNAQMVRCPNVAARIRDTSPPRGRKHGALCARERLERLPGGARTHWKAPPLHGAHVKRPLQIAIADIAIGGKAASERDPVRKALLGRAGAFLSTNFPAPPRPSPLPPRARASARQSTDREACQGCLLVVRIAAAKFRRARSLDRCGFSTSGEGAPRTHRA
jgi:hypothetical protein